MAAAACYARMCGRAAAIARQDEEASLAGREAAVRDARARLETAELSAADLKLAAADLKLAAAEAVRKDGAAETAVAVDQVCGWGVYGM